MPRANSDTSISYFPFVHSDFINRAPAEQSTKHTETVSNIIRDHHKRSSSGPRVRGIGGIGLHGAPGSSRPSPYPSPSASPLLGYDPLPPITSPQSLPDGRGRVVSMPAYGPPSYGGIGGLGQQSNLSEIGSTLNDKPVNHAAAVNSVVSKQNATTTPTAEASERRRKTDVNFACPVPGCGSTFTRHFNLKGMLSYP